MVAAAAAAARAFAAAALQAVRGSGAGRCWAAWRSAVVGISPTVNLRHIAQVHAEDPSPRSGGGP